MMGMRYWRSYAKLNLTLAICGRREDGYHELESVMQQISLYDRIGIALRRDEEIRLRCNRSYIPTDERNLAYRACALYYKESGLRGGADIDLQKRSPVGAGMGGGSSNAATVLRAMNQLHGNAVAEERLHELAASLGADVPFFLSGGAMLARGIGEKLSHVPSLPACSLVICRPPFSVSTPAAYAQYDAYPPQPRRDSAAFLQALHDGDLQTAAANMFNDLEAPVAAQRPAIGEIRERLLGLGALNAMMTGSGSAVFGIFAEEAAARAAVDALRGSYREVFLTRPMD